MIYLAIALSYLLIGISICSIIVYATRQNPHPATVEEMPILTAISLSWPMVILSALIWLPLKPLTIKWFQFLSCRR